MIAWVALVAWWSRQEVEEIEEVGIGGREWWC